MTTHDKTQIKYKSVGSKYSQADLFSFANYASNNAKYVEYQEKDENGIPYKFAPDSSLILQLPIISKEKIKYQFSLDELYTRKYQQLNEIYHPINTKPLTLLGLPSTSSGERITSSDILFNTTMYQNLLGTRSNDNKLVPLDQDSK